MTDDERLTVARELADDLEHLGMRLHASVIRNLLAYAEERLAVNVGLVAENGELRRQVRDMAEGRIEENA
jgi:uncharacterized protein YaeQ